MDCKKIGKYIKDKRKSLGYKQSDLGEMLSVSDKAVSKWECGVALPDVSLLPELSKILNVDIEEILNGEDNPKIEEEIKKKNKSKICLITLSIISSVLFILVIILGIFFINNYDKVHVYKLKGEKDSFYVEGKMISIGDTNYFVLSEFGYNSSEDKYTSANVICFEIYYKNELLYTKTDSNDSNSSREYFKFKVVSFKVDKVFDFNDKDFFVFKIRFLVDDNLYDEISLNLKIYE